jgi:dCTP deaminase
MSQVSDDVDAINAGVWPDSRLRAAIREGVIDSASPIPAGNVQPASLDLRLGPVAYRMRCSFLPGRERVAAKRKEYMYEEIDLTEGAILERDRPYLIPLQEKLNLPKHVRGRTNPKSSTGRVDVFARVVTDRSHSFDEIEPGYSGPLFLEVVSRTFTVRVKEGMTLNQLRLSSGETSVPDSELRRAHAKREIIVNARNTKLRDNQLVINDGLYLTLDLNGSEGGLVGYRARPNSNVLDLTQIAAHEIHDYWDHVYRERDAPRIVLEPDAFYLLISSEAVRVPPEYASEMSAYAESAGELRSHYAGFFDPGFGHDPAKLSRGSRAVLEVRARDVPFMVEQGQPVCKLTFERLTAPPEILYGRETSSNYQGQQATLSKHFVRDHSFEGQLSLLAEI